MKKIIIKIKRNGKVIDRTSFYCQNFYYEREYDTLVILFNTEKHSYNLNKRIDICIENDYDLEIREINIKEN